MYERIYLQNTFRERERDVVVIMIGEVGGGGLLCAADGSGAA